MLLSGSTRQKKPRMFKLPLFLLSVLTLTSCSDLPTWLNHAPLNTDGSLVGLSSPMGLSRAYRYLGYVVNFAAFLALLYFFGGSEADFSNALYVYTGILVGSTLLSTGLDHLLHGLTILPIWLLTVFLLNRFCGLSLRRSVLITVVFQIYQLLYILIFTIIVSKYAK